MICTYDLRGVLPFVSPRIREVLKKIENFDNVCEIRIGKNMPLSLSLVRGAVFVSENGKFLNSPCGAFIADGRDIEKTLELMTNGSVYAVADEIKNGFLTLDGGYRVGICGKAGRPHVLSVCGPPHAGRLHLRHHAPAAGGG